MLVQNSFELVSRCYELTHQHLERDDLKKAFISYVFEIYQEEVVAKYGIEAFHEHLESMNLSNCRRDFDAAVDEWYMLRYGDEQTSENYHDLLFFLVKDAVATYRPESRSELIHDVTKMLTLPDGFMRKWNKEAPRSPQSYYQYLTRLGIRTFADIESLVDMWLMEYPNAFDKGQQKLFARPIRRGRPNNVELSLLIEKAQEFKPSLTPQEKERIRKIYYYHRKSLTLLDMVEKFKRYMALKRNEDEGKDEDRWAN